MRDPHHGLQQGHAEHGPAGHDHRQHQDDDQGGGHHDHHAHMVEDFKRRFWVSLGLTLPILLLSPLIRGLLGLEEAIRFTADLFVLFAFSSVVFLYGGWPFLKGIYLELGNRRPGMMTLIAVAICRRGVGHYPRRTTPWLIRSRRWRRRLPG